jgi:hypothetical protein
MRSLCFSTIATLVITVTLSSPASADLYHFLGFYQENWYYSQLPGAHGPFWVGMASAADVAPSSGQAGPIYWNSFGNTTVGKVIYNDWSQGSCPSYDHSYIFDVFDQFNNYLGRVVTGHLQAGTLAIPVGQFAFNGVKIGETYAGVSSCQDGPHQHVERDASVEWINLAGGNNLQAQLRWTH